jgi:MFS family permease
MTRFLIFLFPAMMDVIAGLLLFVMPMRLAQDGYSSTIVTAATSAWAISYLFSNHFIGMWTNRRNAAWLIILSGLSMVIISGGFVLFPGLVMMFVLMFIAGISTALFFAPFQFFMKIIGGEDNTGVVRSTALYTFSWSAGMAAGPFVAGYILQAHSWEWCMALNALLSIIIMVGIYLLKHHAEKHPHENQQASSPAPAVALADSSYSKMPDLVKMGWIACGLGIFAVFLIRSLFPKTAGVYSLSEFQAGMVLFLLSGSQALTGLCLFASKTWMYKFTPVSIFGCFGLVATVAFGLTHNVWGYYAAAVIFGIYSGTMFFYLVFHSLVHPSKAGRYVAVNEMVVGGCGIFGPLFGGILADKISMSTPYFASAVIILAALIYQSTVYSKMRTRVNEVLAPIPQNN